MSDYIRYNPNYVPGPFGFQNTGSICWGNALIQFLLGMSSINETLLSCENSLANNPFATEYIKLLKLVLPNNGSFKSDDVDTDILSLFSKKILTALIACMNTKQLKLNMGGDQECADEAFTIFIDMLGCPEVENVLTSVYELSTKCPVCNKLSSINRDTSYRIEMNKIPEIKTQEQFQSWLIVHAQKLDYYNFPCGHIVHSANQSVNQSVIRQERLKRLSEIVVIIFNKFYGKYIQWFPQTLKFQSLNNSYLNYKLIGKIEHAGTQSGGHYWTQSLREEWTQLNDNEIPSIGNCKPSAETFMIAYHLTK